MLAKDYAEKSLRPLVTAGVAKDISVTPERVKRASGDMLKLTVRVTRPDYVEETFEFEFAWSDI
jgi:phage gp46-like protein